MKMSVTERTWWLAGAFDMASMDAALLVDDAGERRVIEALDTCSVRDGLLHCGEDDTEFEIANTTVLAYRQDRVAPWLALERDDA